MIRACEYSQRKIVTILIVFGVIRVAFFGAAFSFFDNVDSHAHVDLVIKYSHGILPSNDSIKMHRESAEKFVLYGSPEYFHRFQPDLLPVWKQLENNGNVINSINHKVKRWLRVDNHEALSPPLYYAVLGGWYNVGKLLKVDEKFLLYWLKLLNVIFFAGTMLTAFYIMTLLRPEDMQLRIGVLMILAVFPQDTLYSINNDLLSMLLVPLAWLMLLQVGYQECSRRFIWLTGVVISLTILTKLTNIPMLVFYAMLGVWIICQWHKRSILKSNRRSILELAVLSLLPVCAWFLYNYIVIGDVTATRQKVEYLGWNQKSLSQLWDHPLFELSGVKRFVTGILHTFWRGEFIRSSKSIASQSMDFFYMVSSLILCAFSLTSLSVKNCKNNKYYMLIISSVIIISGYILFLMLITIIYDFEHSIYPSRNNPFLTSGRMMIGALVPFVFLYVIGLQNMLRILRMQRYMIICTFAISCTIMIHEIVISLPSIMSKFNLFGLIYL